jgi:hypothetical protein
MESKARKMRQAAPIGGQVSRATAPATPGGPSVPEAARPDVQAAQDEGTRRILSAPRSPPKDMSVPLVGQLIGFKDNGRTPLVTFPGQPGAAAIPARATVDLQATHIGSDVVLLFEGGDYQKPIVLGVMRATDPNHLAEQPGHVEVEADGSRMFVSAKDQLVLRCGKAMITLTQSGKILIEGTYVSSRSSGVYRIKGGSVQLN